MSSAVDSVTGGSESSSDGSSSSGSSGYGDTFSSGSSGQSFRDAQAGGGSSSGGSSSSSNDSGGGLLDDARNTVDNTVDDARNTVNDAVSGAQNVADTAGDVASNVSRSASEVADATRNQVDHAKDSNSEIEREIQRGDVGAAVDTAVESTGETYDNIARAADAAAGSTDEYVGSAEVNTDVSDDLTRGGLLSETRESNDGLLPGEAGGVDLSEEGFRRAAEDVNDFKKTFDGNEPVTIAGSDVPERVLQGAAGAGVDLLNVPSHIAMAETGVEVAANAPSAIQEYGAGEVAETATGVGAAMGKGMAGEATENPVEFASGTAFGLLTGAAIGKVGSTTARTARGYQATKDVPESRFVDFDEIQRGDVASGQSRLTRHSESAVGPEAKHAMPDDDFPIEPASDPVTELKHLSEAHSPSPIKEALDVGEGESALYHATGRRKGDTYMARSYRDYDPDAIYFAGSTSKNFLPDAGDPEIGFTDLKPRRPKPVKAVRSIFTDEKPTIVATAGKVEKMPDTVETRGDVSRFLRENANNERFYVQNENRQSGEAEALTAAHAAKKENPDPGAGIIGEGEGTEFVNLDEPLATEIRGEKVRIQAMRQRDYFAEGDAGTTKVDLEDSITESNLAEKMRDSPRPGGEPGTPVVPIGGLGYDGGPASGMSPSGPTSVDQFTTSDPYNGGGFGDAGAGDILDVGVGPGRSPGADGPGSTRPTGDGGGPTSPPNSGGPSGGDRSPFPGETGVPTGSPGSGGPSSGSPGSPTSPPGSGSPPSSPPESPPTPPQGGTSESGDPTTPVSSPPGGSPSTPITGPESQSTRPRRWSPESDPKKKKKEDGLEILGTSETYSYGVGTVGGLAFGSATSKPLDEVSRGPGEASKRSQGKSIGLDDIL
ncbi:hypothetical protein EFA46_016025 (plasmid) [Halarchaeum sp. CBA1220]|uniref:hypothetical protein n=1 Tax=Halarchaeum sp. CBA1220 TaxID=1853682 RepID=UPI0015A12E51|nr:hypothetical protein [Halarchaeum sp. CBA1220]QLC35780.1 hypothetical protein EFA46_016025 [Halarchaeum sp. CBA1220]